MPVRLAPGRADPVYIIDPATGEPQLKITPPRYHATLTPDDDNDLSPLPAAIFIAEEGILAIRDAAGTDVTYSAVLVGLLPFVPTRILETTTAVVIGWYHEDPT